MQGMIRRTKEPQEIIRRTKELLGMIRRTKELQGMIRRTKEPQGMLIKGSVQRKLRPMLLYIIQKLFARRWTAKYLNFCLSKGHFTIYIKPLQRSCPSPVTFACKCNNPSANCARGQ